MRLYADLGAERPIVAERTDQKIVVEVKVFGSSSPLSELQKAVGQYSIYRLFIEKVDSERQLFLAISQDTYQDFFLEPAIQEIIDVHAIHLLIFDPDSEEIIEWKR